MVDGDEREISSTKERERELCVAVVVGWLCWWVLGGFDDRNERGDNLSNICPVLGHFVSSLNIFHLSMGLILWTERKI
jgi:hypothetical protein